MNDDNDQQMLMNFLFQCKLNGHIMVYRGWSIIVYPCMSCFNVEVDKINGTGSAASYEDTYEEAVECGKWMIDEMITSIDKLTTSQIDAVILSMKAEGKSAQTIRDFKSVVNQICNYAISRNPPLILTNPCIAVKIPRGLPKSTRSAPDDNTIQTIFDTADSSDPFSVFVLTLLCTGNRRGELIPMLWGQLDFELNQITVDHALRNDFVKTNFCNTRKNRVS